jgi:PAS domain-containing protein
VLIVNAGGAVQFCSNGAAQLFDGRSDEMLGRPINSLIPDLPLQDVTPGYNVAYTCFWSSQDDWHRLHRSVPGGQAAPVEFTLKAARRQQDEPYALVVRLRSAAD